MSFSIPDMAKLAIRAAFNKDWKEAIRINLEILEVKIPEINKTPQDDSKYVSTATIEANLRLGFAYLQIQDYKKARKCYKTVLEMDPINKIALDKMNQVKEEKTLDFIIPDSEILVKEPGTSIEVYLEILTKGLTSEKFKFGEELIYKVTNKIVSIHKDNQTQSLINYLTESVAKYFLQGLKKNSELKVKFIGGKDKKIRVIITSSISIFPSEKQDIRPYVKSSEDMDTVLEEDEEAVSDKVIKTTEEAEATQKEIGDHEEDSDRND